MYMTPRRSTASFTGTKCSVPSSGESGFLYSLRNFPSVPNTAIRWLPESAT